MDTRREVQSALEALLNSEEFLIAQGTCSTSNGNEPVWVAAVEQEVDGTKVITPVAVLVDAGFIAFLTQPPVWEVFRVQESDST